MDDVARHWEDVFRSRGEDEFSWYQARPATSLRLIDEYGPPGGSVIDVGAGASTLLDELAAAGRGNLTALDVAPAALASIARRRGDRRPPVALVVADVVSWRPERTYDVWHDRALFHFLVDPADRGRYVEVATAAVAAGGVAVIATFAADGPTTCSGRPTRGYDADGLAAAFAEQFSLAHAEREEHVTPSGSVQPFTWVVLRRERGTETGR